MLPGIPPSEQLYRHLLDEASAFIYSTDRNGRVACRHERDIARGACVRRQYTSERLSDRDASVDHEGTVGEAGTEYASLGADQQGLKVVSKPRFCHSEEGSATEESPREAA